MKTAEGQNGAPGGDTLVRRARFDSYEKGLPTESFGYYSLKPDEAEGYRVAFRPYSNPAEEQADAPREEDGPGAMDPAQADRELAQLEKERSDLDRELAQAERSADGQAVQELKRRIAAAEQELAARDSGGYRKSHAAYPENA